MNNDNDAAKKAAGKGAGGRAPSGKGPGQNTGQNTGGGKSSKIVGWLGIADERYVTGWITDQRAGSGHLRVIVEVNGVALPAVPAKNGRAHLKKRGFKNPNCGFRFEVPRDVLARASGPVRMWPQGRPDQVITASGTFPRNPSAPTPSAAPSPGAAPPVAVPPVAMPPVAVPPVAVPRAAPHPAASYAAAPRSADPAPAGSPPVPHPIASMPPAASPAPSRRIGDAAAPLPAAPPPAAPSPALPSYIVPSPAQSSSDVPSSDVPSPAGVSPASSTARIVGWLAVDDGPYAHGWIADENAVSRHLRVVVEVNGVILPAIPARDRRAHLKKRGFKDTHHGFKLYVPRKAMGQGSGLVRMWAEDVPSQVIEADSTFPARQPVAGPPLLTALRDAAEATAPGGTPDPRVLADIGTDLLADADLESILQSTGEAMAQAGRDVDALRLLDASAALFPDSPETQRVRAAALSKAGKDGEAIEILKELRRLRWKPLQVLPQLSGTLMRVIDRHTPHGDRALEITLVAVIRELIAIDDGTAVYTPGISIHLARRNELELALTVADRQIAQSPDDPDGRIDKSRILIELGRYDEGLALSRDVLKIWPGNKAAQSHLKDFSGHGEDEGALVLARLARGWRGRPADQ